MVAPLYREVNTDQLTLFMIIVPFLPDSLFCNVHLSHMRQISAYRTVVEMSEGRIHIHGMVLKCIVND
jgi:hypothetical protein